MGVLYALRGIMTILDGLFLLGNGLANAIEAAERSKPTARTEIKK